MNDMNFLRNFDVANKYFDLVSNTEIKSLSDPNIVGWYKIIDKHFSALLVQKNELYFLFEKDKYLITDNFRVIIKSITQNKNEFILMDNDIENMKFMYEIEDVNISLSPFEYIDEEDFKWEEFIMKTINDQERKNNLILNLQ
jgi:hypothetical protein